MLLRKSMKIQITHIVGQQIHLFFYHLSFTLSIYSFSHVEIDLGIVVYSNLHVNNRGVPNNFFKSNYCPGFIWSLQKTFLVYKIFSHHPLASLRMLFWV